MGAFQIELHKKSGIYYAGEVITGTLTVTAPNEQCRSLLLRLIGKAKIHWHTGSGDDRKDYDGEKTFVYANRCLWGSYYQTCVLDEAGSDATYGGAVSDGTIYIPCQYGEGSGRPMHLIVRVRDYDWGKRDDNLGELVIDADQLASDSRDSVTFDLTRNGRPEKGSITLSARFVPTSTVLPISEDSSSSATPSSSSSCLILNVISANGLRKADWVGKNDVYVQVYRKPSDLTLPPPSGKKLPGPDKKITLPPTPTRFPFAFPTRVDAPGSIVLNAGDRAYVAYYLYAKIDKKYWKDPSYKMPIVVLPNRPVPLPSLLSHYSRTTDPEIVYKNKTCCFKCGKAGLVDVTLALRRLAYAPGEKVSLKGSKVDNNSNTAVTVSVVLRQSIVLQTTGNYAHATNAINKFPIYNAPCEARNTFQLRDDDIILPAVPPSFFGATGLQSARREPLQWTYEISLEAKIKGGSKVVARSPVLISALPPTEKAIQDANGSKRDVLDLGSAWDVKDHAVLDSLFCPTVKLATGTEDGGTLLPSACGTGPIYDKQEDAGDIGGSKNYSPMVNTFTTNEEYQGALEQKNEVCVPATEINSSVAVYEELLSRIKAGEYNSRLAVDGWIKQYPSVAASLTSEEFVGVLLQVPFSFEQASVARELMSGMSDGITTTYILDAFRACPYSKLDLAKAMAPGVSDPENKGCVLSELLSFERDEVSKMFPS